jgi:hypothetical protein
MTEAPPAHATSGTSRADNDTTATLGLTERLCLAATPTFAAMALLSSLAGDPMDMICSAQSVPLNGMTLMYLLMSLFHSPPWLRLGSVLSKTLQARLSHVLVQRETS